jgi:hypothetical protein
VLLVQNEIGLLTKLRGNERVIELIDSQVDTGAGKIYMVRRAGRAQPSAKLTSPLRCSRWERRS